MLELEQPAVFGVPPGADFPKAVAEGLLSRMSNAPPEDLARICIIVNSRRMARRLTYVLGSGEARLLPRIRTILELGEIPSANLPARVSRTRRRLELARLIGALLEAEPELASRAAMFDLADSLATLMDEIQAEGVPLARILEIDPAELSLHWQVGLRFLGIVRQYIEASSEAILDSEARQHCAIERFIAQWPDHPPKFPVIMAGSTGSRGSTELLMRAIARLQNGALVLPGFDFDLPSAAWRALGATEAGEDHPQYRFARLLGRLELDPRSVKPWAGREPVPARNRLLSLALRPAPITDQWMSEGPEFADFAVATEGVTLIEAPTARSEGRSIALVLHDAVADGLTCALVTPDRTLARMVTASLDRWRLTPDDSAGRPLSLTPPGRFLRHTANLLCDTLSAEALVVLLKHPLTSSGTTDRGPHLLISRELELSLRRYGPPHIDAGFLKRWGSTAHAPAMAGRWSEWLAEILPEPITGSRPLPVLLEKHLAVTEHLARGPNGVGSGDLWCEAAGEAARAAIDELRNAADAGGELSAFEYSRLITSVLGDSAVREDTVPYPGLSIFGSQEARVQGVDLLVVGGLNESVWPGPNPPDPWLSRGMRRQAGLHLPERRIGLAAHDFQIAACAPRVVLSRALRDASAETVPSRWLIRITNLLGGLSDESRAALDGMRRRGAAWIARSAKLEAPPSKIRREPRPAPCPPVEARPTSLSITDIERLIRDPYAIYAKRILRLRELAPLSRKPEAADRGNILHAVLEHLMDYQGRDYAGLRAHFLEHANASLIAEVPWPGIRRLWMARLERIADVFIAGEIQRRFACKSLAPEVKASLLLPEVGVSLEGRIDRVDREEGGSYRVYDYKTGSLPSRNQIERFDKQLYLSALVVSSGGAAGVPSGPVSLVGHIGLGSNPEVREYPVAPDALLATRSELVRLLAAWAEPTRGFVSRRAPKSTSDTGLYDHLARYGEWDQVDPPVSLVVGR